MYVRYDLKSAKDMVIVNFATLCGQGLGTYYLGCVCVSMSACYHTKILIKARCTHI
jgi:hypothetical protein